MSAQNTQVKARVWIMTDYAFHLPESDRREAIKWYPGDAWVEAIAADAYNWHDCRPGIEVPWTPLRANIAALRAFGAAHPDEQLMLTETGSAEDENTPGRNAQWVSDTQGPFKEPGYEQFTLISWFNLHHNGDPSGCDWPLSTGADALAAYKAIGEDPFYGGATIPEPDPMIGTGTVDASSATASRWTAFSYEPAVSGAATMTLGWQGTGTLKFDVRTADGSWIAADIDEVAPHRLVANVETGTTYQVEVWSADGIGAFEVASSIDAVPPVVMAGTADIAGATGPRWQETSWVAPSTGTASVELGWVTTADLRIDVRASDGSWIAANTTAAQPKVLTFAAQSGVTYRIAVWSLGGAATFEVSAEVH